MSTPTMTASTIRRLSAYLTTAVLLTTVGLIGTAHAASTPTLSINGPFEAPVGQELQVYG